MGREAVQEVEPAQQVQRHHQHERRRQQLHPSLGPVGEADGRAQRAHRAARQRVGNDPPRVVVQVGPGHSAAGLRRLAALGQVDAPAHGHAMQGGHHAHQEQRTQAHARLGHGEGAEPGRPCRATAQGIQPRHRQQRQHQPQRAPPALPPGAQVIARRLQRGAKLRLGQPVPVPQGGQGGAAIIRLWRGKPRQGCHRPHHRALAVGAVHAGHFPGGLLLAHRPFFQLTNFAAMLSRVSAGRVMTPSSAV